MNKTVAPTAAPRLFSLNNFLLKALAAFPLRVLMSCLLMFLMFHQPLLVLAATKTREASKSTAWVVKQQISSNQAEINESRMNNPMAEAPPPVAATLALTPAEVGTNVTGTTQALSAAFKDTANNPLSGKQVTFTVTGANPRTGTATTSVNGIAVFNLNGAASGVDTIRAAAADGGATVLSNNSTVTWITPAQAISTTTVLGRFFNGTTTGGYEVPAGQQPLFTQQFPSVNFNPAPNTIINQPADVNTYTRPMVNVTTDTAGNYTGKITVKGNGYQVGKTGSLMPVAATFSANFNVAVAGNVTFNFYSDDGFYLGIGNGATRVSGVNVSIPASGRTAYLNLPIMGGYNKKTAPIANSITVNFPAPGTYPYEIDWADCCMTQEALTMTTSLTGRSVPPAGSIVLTPGTTTPKPTGQAQTFTATVTNAAGAVVANQAVIFKVTGANPREVNATTNASGKATLTYAGAIAGTDQIQVTGQITGMPMFSNSVQQQWQTSNAPPVVNAGADQSVILPNTATLSGTASDDGLPQGSSVTKAWSKVSGPGTVSFANPGALQTTASFSAVGTYVLRLTAGDGSLVTSDDTVITVNRAPVASFTVPGMSRNAATWSNNLASYFEGASVIAASSQYGTGDNGYQPANIIDDNPSTQWLSATGQTINQSLTIALPAGSLTSLDRIRLLNSTSSTATKNFQVQTSATTTDEMAWTTVLSDTALQNNRVQEFALPAFAQAKYVRLLIADNYGSTSGVSLRSFEVINSTKSGIPSYFAHPVNAAQIGEGDRIAAVSSELNSSYDASKAIDGSNGSYWYTASGQVTNTIHHG